MTKLKVPGNVPEMNVGELVDTLSDIYSNFIISDTIKEMPSVMLWGPPGVGKSQAVQEIGTAIKEKTGKECVYHDVRLLLFNPVDLRGIPVADKNREGAIWLMPDIFKMSKDKDIVNILFLDEISAAPPSVQAAAYQLTLDRKIGEHKLHDNTIVIAAGNRVQDRSVAFRMPKALANRLLHIDVVANIESWQRWAIKHGINDKVISFIAKRPDLFIDSDGKEDILAYATPRTWELVSKVLNTSKRSIMDNRNLIAGLVGMGTASEFISFCDIYSELPDVRDIFDGKVTVVPQKADAQYAVVASMAAYAREHKDDIDKIINSLIYASKLPNEFVQLFMRMYQSLYDNYVEDLMPIPEWQDLCHIVGGELNGQF